MFLDSRRVTPVGSASPLALAMVLCLLAAGGAYAEGQAVRYEFTPRHQSATALAPNIVPFLSPGGSLELKAVGKTLVVIDSPATIAKIVPLLKHLDRPSSPIEVSIRLVRGWQAAVSGEPAPVLPLDLGSRLARLMPGRRYELIGQKVITSHEGARVRETLETGLSVSFEVGTVLAGRRLRLGGFTLSRAGEAKSLVLGDVNLWVDRPVALALAESSAAEALVLVVEARPIIRLAVPTDVGRAAADPGAGPVTRPLVGGDPTNPPRPR